MQYLVTLLQNLCSMGITFLGMIQYITEYV
jgi:hypothetical protein